ncbi:hypothetical protein OY671_007318 [Metschnikowia pulcherrima]|nr:hypothetical protein OY671_007318 [Metschnikowia pulcherrima]
MIFSHVTILLSVMTVTMSSEVPDPLGNDIKHPLPQHPNDPAGKKLEKIGDIRRRHIIADEYDENSPPGIFEKIKSDDTGSQKQFPVNFEEFLNSKIENIPNQDPGSSTPENSFSEPGMGAASKAEFENLFEEIARIQNLAETMPPKNFHSTLQVYAYIIGLHEEFLQRLQASKSQQWHEYPKYDEFQQKMKRVHQRVRGMRRALQRRSLE